MRLSMNEALAEVSGEINGIYQREFERAAPTEGFAAMQAVATEAVNLAKEQLAVHVVEGIDVPGVDNIVALDYDTVAVLVQAATATAGFAFLLENGGMHFTELGQVLMEMVLRGEDVTSFAGAA